MLLLCFTVGLMVGGTVGVLVAAMLAAGAREDRCRKCGPVDDGTCAVLPGDNS